MTTTTTAKGTARDKQDKSFVKSPTRKHFSAQEVVVGNNEDIPVSDFNNISLLKLLITEIRDLKTYLNKANKFFLQDGTGKNNDAKINSFNALKVYDQGIPDVDDPALTVPTTSFLTDINGSKDMRVNASIASPQDFFIRADENIDTYVTTLSFLISDQNAILSNFGAINELNNGCQLILSTSELGEQILADNLTTNYSFIRLCVNTIGISDNVSAYRADNISGNSEGYSCILNITSAFGNKFGLRLRAGTKDKLILRIRDNISLIDAFDCLTYGIKII